jgi:DNA-binding NarL/FixJ family response regulator
MKLRPPALTDRQRQVAEGIAEGLTNDEIGDALGISPRTVKAHVDAIKLKLGVRRRRLIPPTLRDLEGRK